MKYKTTAGLALSAFMLAGCNSLSEEEIQAQLDAALEKVDVVPVSSGRFQERSDPEGQCGVLYDDKNSGVVVKSNYGMGVYFEDVANMTYLLAVDCSDLKDVHSHVSTRLDTYNVIKFNDINQMLEALDSSRELLRASVYISADVRRDNVTGIRTFGLE